MEKAKNKILTLSEIQEQVRQSLISNQMYSTALEPQIESLATALRNLRLANSEIDGLTATTIKQFSSYGERIVPHPAFRVSREAQELVTSQMKILGLRPKDLNLDTETDELAELTRKLAEQPDEIVKPKM